MRTGTIWTRVALLAALFALPAFGCSDDDSGTGEVCTNDLDDDGDGQTDCDDSDCTADPACEVETETVCDDELDDDGDGQTDCDDSDCTSDPACVDTELICGDDLDNDGDGQTDCDDSDCDDSPACLPDTETVCDDSLDDDGDGDTDCDDADCDADPACLPETLCGDDLDDDGDGDTDCADADCAADPLCLPESLCNDDLDNDGDGDTDCTDADCVAAPACLPEGVCDNDLDDDLDGDTDCADADCVAALNCIPETLCDNDLDDDLDGDTDCTDADCAADPVCIESICDDATDNDGDGSTDCDDTDCAAAINCIPEADCGDGLDDDLDGDTDCTDADCAADPLCLPESICDDGLDSDADGDTDCADADCAAAAACNPTGNDACATAFALPDDPNGVWHGDSSTATGDYGDASCGGGGDGLDVVFEVTLTGRSRVTADLAGSAFDTVLWMRNTPCDTGTQVACNDDAGGDVTSRFTVTLDAGTYYLIVDAYDVDDGGEYDLALTTEPLELCTGGADEDGDTLIDCADGDCRFDAACAPAACAEDAREENDTAATATPATALTAGEYLASVNPDLDYYAIDVCAGAVVDVTAYFIDASGDIDIYLERLAGTVIASSAGTADNEHVAWTSDTRGTVYLRVRNYTTTPACNLYQLGVSVDVSACIYTETLCNNGIDEDGDGTVDCADSDCSAGALCGTETSCSNGTDDDTDGLTDCFDPGCISACTVTGNDTCTAPRDLGNDPVGIWYGDTTTAASDYSGSCGGSGARDVVYQFTLTGRRSVTIDLSRSGYDTLVYLRSGTCTSSTTLFCDNDSGEGNRSLIRATLAAGTYFLMVDGNGSASFGAYAVQITTGPAEVCTGGTDEDGDGATDCADSDCATDAACLVTGNDTCTAPRDLGNNPNGTWAGDIAVLAGDYSSTCGGTTGREAVYQFAVTARSTVVLTTQGSTYDTVLYVRAGACTPGTPVNCNDDNPSGGTWSRLSLTLDPGTYWVFPDAYYATTTTGTYVLNITTTPL